MSVGIYGNVCYKENVEEDYDIVNVAKNDVDAEYNKTLIEVSLVM